MNYHYLLLDACVVAAFFAPKSTTSRLLGNRSLHLIKEVRQNKQVKLLIPNFCIAEVFSVFEKYRWGLTWNKHVKPNMRLTPAEFNAARDNFREAIHNGASILQVDLNRYHILCVDLISPINNAYKIRRERGRKHIKQVAKNQRPSGAYDMLIAAMGIWLSNQYGKDNFSLITGDTRLASVVNRSKSTSLSEPMRNHLVEIATSLNLQYSPDLYPYTIDLTKDAKIKINTRLGHLIPAFSN